MCEYSNTKQDVCGQLVERNLKYSVYYCLKIIINCAQCMCQIKEINAGN